MAHEPFNKENPLQDPRKTIFLADRSENFLMYLRILLERIGFRVVPLKKGELLKDLLQVMKPDLILLGAMLEDMEGFSLLRGFRQDDLYSQIPFVLLCNTDEEESLRNNKEVGGIDCLSRPVNIFKLYKVIYDKIVFSTGEKRENLRTPFREQVTVTHRGESDNLWSTTLSEGGIYLRTRSPLPVGEEVKVDVPLGFDPPASIDGEIIYINKDVSGLVMNEPGMAVRFSSLLPEFASQLMVCILGLLVGDILEEQDEPVISLVSRTNELYEEIVLQHIRLDQKLKSYQLQMKNIIEALPLGMLMYKMDDCGDLILISSNRAAEGLLGTGGQKLSPEELASLDWGKFGLLDEMKRICSEGGTFEADNVTYKEGKRLRILDVMVFQPNAGNVAVILSDATARKKLEEERLRYQKLETVGSLAGGIAHDFNNQLGIMLVYSELAKMSSESGSTPYRMIEDLENSIYKAKKLTEQLLTFSKGGEPVKKTIYLKQLIIDSVRLGVSRSNINSRLSVADDLWPVEADEGQMIQVVNNLIINAVQAMPEGGTVRVSADNRTVIKGDVPPLTEGRYVEIQVEDTGIGIPEKHLPMIFDPFYSTKQKGSGLGLSIAYSIVNKHDGLINVESESGKGTVFSVFLPASEKEVEEEERKEPPKKMRARVLVMDDEEDLKRGCCTLLEALGCKTDSAADGEEALEKYREARESGNPFDIVILDLTVHGGMGGKETIVKLTEIDPDIKAIVSSGYSDDPIMASFLDYGFKAALAKPYNSQQLMKVLREVFPGSD